MAMARASVASARSPSGTVRSWRTAFATASLSRAPPWVSDRLTGKALTRRVNVDPEKAPRLVALRVVELLRASLLELVSPPHDEAPLAVEIGLGEAPVTLHEVVAEVEELDLLRVGVGGDQGHEVGHPPEQR